MSSLKYLNCSLLLDLAALVLRWSDPSEVPGGLLQVGAVHLVAGVRAVNVQVTPLHDAGGGRKVIRQCLEHQQD